MICCRLDNQHIPGSVNTHMAVFALNLLVVSLLYFNRSGIAIDSKSTS